MNCQSCGSEVMEGAAFCPNCGAAVEQVVKTAPVIQQTPEKPLGMKWFKFTIYFQLFACALINFYNGLMMVTGAQYGAAAAGVYADFPTLKFIDLGMGGLSIALAAFSLYTRFQLAGFKKHAPQLMYSMLVLNLVYIVAFNVLASVVLHTSTFDARTYGNITGAALLLIIDVIYFGNRADLFKE